MSWGRNLFGDVKHIAAAAEAEAKKLAGYGDTFLNQMVATFESDLAKEVGRAFELGGQKLDDMGNALKALGLHIESSGHFSADGSGQMVLKVTSNVTPAALPEPIPDIVPDKPAEAPPPAKD